MNFMSNEAVKVSQTFALDTDRTYNATSSSLKPEQEMVINKTTDGTTMAVEIQKMSQETEVIVSEEQKKSTDSYTAAVFESLLLKNSNV